MMFTSQKFFLKWRMEEYPSLDNIIVCGEDDSENLILSFYGTFPEANVSRLEFDDLDLTDIDEETKEKFSAFSILIATAIDYYDELSELHDGINLLPKSVKEEQKFFQFSWHSYAILPLLFIVGILITQEVLENSSTLSKLDAEIAEKTLLMRQNQETLGKIAQLEGKISSFDQTQAILDSATVGTGVWNEILSGHFQIYQQEKKYLAVKTFAK